jgi:hypothetical protein
MKREDTFSSKVFSIFRLITRINLLLVLSYCFYEYIGGKNLV